MEGSAGAAPAAASGEQGEAQEQQGEQQQQAGPDLSYLEGVPDTLEQMRSMMEQVAAGQQAPPPEQEPEGYEYDQPDLSYADPTSPNYNPDMAGQVLMDAIGQQQQQALQQALDPLQQKLSAMEADQQARALAEQFPELNDQKVADEVFAKTREWVDAAGLPAEAAQNYQVVKAVYMMGRAAELAASEQGSGEADAATLEGGGGPAPAPSDPAASTWDAIKDAGPRQVLPY